MHVVIIGGGLAGLAAAHELADSGARVVLLERSHRLGGQIHTERVDGFVVEHGAEGFAAGSTQVLALCEQLGLARRVISQAAQRSYLSRGDELHELRAGEAASLLGFGVPASERGRGIRALRGGMSEFVEALASRLSPPAEIRLGCETTSLTREESGWRVVATGGSTLSADAVIVAAPPDAAAPLVSAFAPAAARRLAGMPLVSSLTVSLAYRRDAVRHPLDGSGFVVPEESSSEGFRACTFSSSKWEERAPEGWCLLRAFFRPRASELHDPDDVWRDRAASRLARVLGIEEPPARAWVSRWRDALLRDPEHHAGAAAAAEPALREAGSLELAGAAYHCCGIEGAVASGIAAARRTASRAG